MEEILKHVDDVLRGEFPGASTELEYLLPDEKVTGFLLWPGFDGQEPIDRQHRVSDVLRARLSDEERAHVSVLFALTPNELAFYRAENVTA
jgi:hypothetical protein